MTGDYLPTRDLQKAALLLYAMVESDGVPLYRARRQMQVSPAGEGGILTFLFPDRDLQEARMEDIKRGRVRVDPVLFMEAYNACRDFKFPKNRE